MRTPQRPGTPHVVVLSSLFPSSRQPGAGLFVRERVFRVGHRLPLAVVAPTPWFPFQHLLRRWEPGFRPGAPAHEQQQGFDVWYPPFLSLPGVLKRLDGWLMALGAYPRLRQLRREGRLDLIDAHFGYPDGYAAMLLGRWLGVPVAVTLRGTEERHARDAVLGPRLRRTLQAADRVITVSQSLQRLATGLGIATSKTRVVGNGVDLERFKPIDKALARAALNLPMQARVLITVGGLVERKGFHRVIACLPALRQRLPDLHYLVVGGPSPEGDWTDRLKALTGRLGLDDCVHFLGPVASADLHRVLSAADVFALSTRNEGWANVLLEAMACGLPVVATDVGGNAEVVSAPELGTIVPFDDELALVEALESALTRSWDREALLRHAQANTWDRRVDVLEAEFISLVPPSRART
jgi:glycosyltransferase involved in cell wall biosynthesis